MFYKDICLKMQGIPVHKNSLAHMGQRELDLKSNRATNSQYE